MESVATQIARRVERLKVLVVDDDPRMRKVVRALLQVIGIRDIHEAHDGQSGLATICARAPDMVLLDWEMPSPNGPEFMRRVRSPGTFPLPDVPVIMLTGYSERSRVVEAMRLGVNEFSAQAGFIDRFIGSYCVDPGQTAADDKAGRLLRPRTAPVHDP